MMTGRRLIILRRFLSRVRLCSRRRLLRRVMVVSLSCVSSSRLSVRLRWMLILNLIVRLVIIRPRCVVLSSCVRMSLRW